MATQVPSLVVDGLEPLLTVADVARLLRLKPATVRQMARDGRLPALRIGAKHIRFTAQALRVFLNTCDGTKNIGESEER